jgi:hypothetical protein
MEKTFSLSISRSNYLGCLEQMLHWTSHIKPSEALKRFHYVDTEDADILWCTVTVVEDTTEVRRIEENV